LSTGGDARLEGSRLKAGGDADVNVKGDLKFDAARDTSRRESLSADGSLNLGASTQKDLEKEKQTDAGSFGFSAKGQYEKSASDKAVTGSIGSGGDLRVRAGGDAVLEGTGLRANDKASVSAGRDLTLKAATDTAETMKFSGDVALGAGSKTVSTLDKDGAATPDNTADTRKGAFALSGDYAKSDSRRGATVQAGAGGAELAAGRDLAMQGGSVKSAGDAALTAAGDMRLETATSTSNSIGASFGAAQSTTRNTVSTDKDESEGKKSAALRGGTSETNQGTAINSGGQIVLKSGGATGMTNTEATAARGVVTEAGKGVKTATVKDRNDVLNLGVSSKNSSTGAPLAKENAPAWTPAAPARESSAAKPSDSAKNTSQGPVIGAARESAKARTPVAHKAAQKTASKKPVKARPVIGEARKTAAQAKAASPLP
jgi:filamentous hemagglutinin